MLLKNLIDYKINQILTATAYALSLSLRLISFSLDLSGARSQGESKLKIVELAYDMNKQGKRRSLSKTDYVNLLKKTS